MTTILAWVCAALLALSATTGYMYQRDAAALKASNAALQKATEDLLAVAEQRKQDARTLALRNAEIVSQRRKLAVAQQGLQTALQGAPSWSEADVPTQVIKALPGRSGASNAKPK